MMDLIRNDIHWLWVMIALGFLLLELTASTGFFLGIVAAGVLMGAIDYATDLPWQQSVILFAVLSGIFSFIWLKYFKKDEEKPTDAPTLNSPLMAMVGKQFQLQQTLETGDSSIMLGSSMHPVRYENSEILHEGEWIKVSDVDGNTLIVTRK